MNRACLVVLAVVVAAPAGAAPLRPEDVPPDLKPWVPWALYGHESSKCPVLEEDGAPVCAWAGRLSLAVDARGGRFAQAWQMEAEGEVPLPGDRDHWPLDVRAAGRKLVVLDREEGPTVILPRGQHELSGTFSWTSLPEVLPVPAATGLLSLTLAGREIAFPQRTEEGHLFLATAAPGERAEAEADKLEITVHRKVTDGVPLLLETRIDLAVTGKSREVVLAAPLPEGWAAHAIRSRLRARLEPDGKLRLQLRAGTHTVIVTGRFAERAAAITRPAPAGLWQAGDEIWAFEARPDLRLVTVAGVPAVDPRQSQLPDEWRALPAYLVAPGATLKLDERRRGHAEPAPDRLHLERRLWLDFDGGGYTVRDLLSGRMERGARLEMGPGQELGRVVVAGADQPITQLKPGGPAGVEVRQANLAVTAEGRIVGARRTPPAVGWAHDFQSVTATLALPPGWRLVHGGGADEIGGTLLRSVSLLDLFLVLVVALAAARLFGWATGALALVMMALLVKAPGAPTWIFLAVLVGEALVRALPAGGLRRVAKAYRAVITLVLLVVALPFALEEVRAGLHPGVERAGDVRERFTFARSQHYAAEEHEKAKPAASPPPPAAAPAPKRAAPVRKKVARQAAREEEDEGVEGAVEGGVAGGVVGGGILKTLEGVRDTGSLGAVQGPAGVGAIGETIPLGTLGASDGRRLREYDPNAEVQTGPGIPRWRWTEVPIRWNGPVDRGARLELWLMPPWLGLVVSLVRVFLLGIFVIGLLRAALASWGRFLPRAAGALGLALLLGAAPARAAEWPPAALIEELRTRLTEPPECHPRCASFGRMAVEAAPERLRLRLEADALAPSAVDLPGLAQHWAPSAVSVDGAPARALFLDEDGRLWLLLAPGAHTIVLEGPVGNRATVQIPFGQVRPHALSASLRGFSLIGVAEDGALGDSLELVRGAAAGGTQAAEAETPTLPPFVFVERTLALGLEWRVHTRVERATPPGAAVVTAVALLPGESVLSSGVKVAAGKVQVNMGPNDDAFEWSSVIEQKSPIALAAPALGDRAGGMAAEVWRLDASALWHVHTSGIPPVHPGAGADSKVQLWRPWPGESVSIEVSRPAGTKGQTLTIDASTLEVTPGARGAEALLVFTARASRGGEHTVLLPEEALLTKFLLDGREQALRQEGKDQRRVVVPLRPGSQEITLGFRTPRGMRPIYRTPVVDLGAPAVNADVVLKPGERFVLWTAGPRLGPAVRLPTAVLLVLLVAWLLGRARVLPLPTHQLVVLGLGFLPLAPAGALVVVGLLFALGWRRTHLRTERALLYDFVQLVLAGWALIAVAVLLLCAREGLLSTPDMDVAGNGSSATLLRWTADRTGGVTPTGWLISLPLFAYHVAMLAWALWLAVTLVRTTPWVWSCFTAGGLWRPLTRRRPPAAQP